MIEPIMRALAMALAMGWEILWPLILGFALSAVVQAAVSHHQMSQLLPGDRPHSIATALAPTIQFSPRCGDRLIGPLAAVISFVCSVGNIPLAAVLWNGGISFGGVVAFIFADLIILPILNIYRKYYGLKMAGFLFATFYVAMAAAALIVDLIFGSLALIPSERQARVVEASIAWNYTTWLNLAFLILAGLLISRFLKTGGPAMLRRMNRPADHGDAHHHAA
jgi:uncharacterized membrane protein YraQ (UPF0718 family)